ncbi:MAG: MBL fold metallo-hydrolase [Ruminococcaceae bacterium]|nr:MBL fold metallo-hydrolase [Oscillospiraceae bacterium]
MKNTLHMLHSVTDTICNSFIITTEDEKIIVIDGGFQKETDHFLEYLKNVSGSDTPRVDAWFLTHPHDDHASVFFEMMKNRKDALDLGKVYLNFPSAQFVESDAAALRTMEEFYECLPLFADKLCICSGGDVFSVGSAKFFVLYSPDFEINTDVCNNSSLVFRMELGGKSFMFTGDCGLRAGKKVLRLWKESGLMKCDFCQMAHHGQNGCDRDFYEAVSPSVCLWPTPTWLWNNDAGKGYNTHTWQTIEVREWMDELNIETHYVAKDGDCAIEI